MGLTRIICVGNSKLTYSNTNKITGEIQQTVMNYIDVFNSDLNVVERLPISETQEIHEIFSYFQEIQDIVRARIDYFCYKLHNGYDNKFRKVFVEAANRHRIKNAYIVGEAKALLLDAISMFRRTLQQNDVFSSRDCKVRKNDSTIILSKRDCFLASYPHQSFWLSDSVMHYLTKKPSSAKGYQKIIKTCKYFFIKNPIFVILCLLMECKDNRWWAYFDDKVIVLKNLTSKLWITDMFNVTNENPTDKCFYYSKNLSI